METITSIWIISIILLITFASFCAMTLALFGSRMEEKTINKVSDMTVGSMAIAVFILICGISYIVINAIITK